MGGTVSCHQQNFHRLCLRVWTARLACKTDQVRQNEATLILVGFPGYAGWR